MVDKIKKMLDIDQVVVKFAGDSGDGMQLTGTQFSDNSAILGNDLATFPDFPSEIRAPQGTVAGVSGFQVHIGHVEIQTPGDKADVLVAMNPAALITNMKWVKDGATIIVDSDNFEPKNLKKAGYEENPLTDGTLDGFKVLKAPITMLSRESIKELGLDTKTMDKTRNQFALGILFWLFNRDLKIGEEFLNAKFGKKPILADANKKVLQSGYHYANTTEVFQTTYHVKPSEQQKGTFRNITGNIATAWGLMAAAEKSKKPLFLGSYPITPATEILQELSRFKSMGVKTFQAEDEIAGITSSIGASFAGNLAATSTSGPGLALKGEAIGLAVITELPLVIVNVQRGGPSTGLPTKPEQSDLLQALYGRNGESPVVVIASSTPANCFDYAFKAAKISLEHMTPVILLTDGYLANGSQLWKIPDVDEMEEIIPQMADPAEGEAYEPYKRNPENLARYWAVPGTPNLRHRIGGLEKQDGNGKVSHDPMNHQVMTNLREEKVQKVADFIPEQEIIGNKEADLLVVSWGGTYGAVYTAVKKLQKEGKSISLAHFNYIKPLPKNTADIFKGFKKTIVCEINMGQFAKYLRSEIDDIDLMQYNKVQGLPFMVSELVDKFNSLLEQK